MGEIDSRRTRFDWNKALDAFVPERLLESTEKERRARLLVRFGFAGGIFGLFYSLFYLLVGHIAGGVIVAGCSFAFVIIPHILAQGGGLKLPANLFMATLTIGFTILTLIEGGMDGHAIAWLSSIPLCGLLLCSNNEASVWCIVTMLVGSFFGLAHVAGVEFPEVYPENWHLVIDAAGYIGLVPFLAILGYIFEVTRTEAFAKKNEANAKLQIANYDLRSLNLDKNEFLAIAAHDLKNPLSVALCYGEMINGGITSDPREIKEYSGEIVKSAAQMLDIVNQLLDVQKIETGENNISLTKCAIDQTIARVVRSVEGPANQKNIQITSKILAANANILGDEQGLFQILENFLSNAVKYSSHGTCVSVIAEEEGRSLIVKIVDQGPGLSKEDQIKLFGKFARLTPRPTGGESSSGLGLWITKRMAQQMNGSVFCHSAEGEGSTFGVRLPQWDESQVCEIDYPIVRGASSDRNSLSFLSAAQNPSDDPEQRSNVGLAR